MEFRGPVGSTSALSLELLGFSPSPLLKIIVRTATVRAVVGAVIIR